MNNKQLTKLLNEPTTNIPSLLNSLSQEQIKKLLAYLSDKYYNEEHVIPDEKYDEINDFYTKTFGILSEVGAPVKKGMVTLPIFMGSLDKIKTEHEIELFKKRNGQNYVISTKLDGISTLLYKNNNEFHLYTRGNGETGKDITHVLPFIDLNTKLVQENNVMFRGELVISKSDFSLINTNNDYTHPRNFIISMLNSKKSMKTDLLKYITFIPYLAIKNNQFTMRKSEQLDFIKTKHFSNKQLIFKTTNNLQYDDLVSYYIQNVTNYNYELDGLVVSNDDASFPIIDGEKYPKHEIAFKHSLEENVKKTVVTNVEWNISKNGLLKPIVNYEPTDVIGYTLKNATGNNAKFIVDNGIGEGAEIMITLSGGVIPKIVEVTKKVNAVLPENIVWDGVDIKPKNIDSVGKMEIVVKQMVYFCETIGIDFMRGKTMERVIETIIEEKGNAFLNFNEDVKRNILFEFVKYKVDDFMRVPRFGVESSQKIVQEFKKLENVPIEKLMDASQFFKRIGTKKLKLLFDVFPNFIEMYKKMKHDIANREELTASLVTLLNDIKGYETITSMSIIEGIDDYVAWVTEFLKIYPNLIEVKTQKQETNNEFSQFKGMKIVFTGFRDSAVENGIEKAGGKVTTSVSKNTSLVVAKDVNEPSGKITEATRLGIKIISQEEFYEMLVKKMAK